MAKYLAAEDEAGIRRILLAIGAELLDDAAHLGLIENADTP